MLQPSASSASCTLAARTLYGPRHNWGMAKEPRFRPNFIREWRKHRHLSLEQLAARVPMDKGNLSKVERSLLPYNQEMLERLAEALMTDPASLIMRDPTAPEAIWSIWDRASPGVRRQIESVAETLLRTGTSG